MMQLGFIGTGALTSAIVTGIKSVADNSVSVFLSPRNAEIAAGLAARYPDVRVAPDNQAVLDDCDTVMLAVRPQIAHEVLSGLRFRRWLRDRGVADSRARDYIAALFKALANAPETMPDAGFINLAEEYATRGGINEQVLSELTARNVFDLFAESLDRVHRRISDLDSFND